MDITEKDLEDLIFDDLKDGGNDLDERGFDCLFFNHSYYRNKIYWYRQVSLKSYGIADIIGFSRQNGVLYVEVIELKNRPIKIEDFEQVFRYRQAIHTIIKNSFKDVSHYIHCTLVGSSYESGHYTQNMITECTVIEFKFSVRGFEFESHPHPGWHKTDCSKMTIKDIKCPNEIIIPGLKSTPIKLNGEAIY